MLRAWVLLGVLCSTLQGHAPPTPIPIPPIRVNANTLIDSAGMVFVLRGVGVPEWDSAPPPYRVIQQRWNMNAVRLPVDIATWRRDGQPYFDRLAKSVAAANAERLVAILAAVGDDASGLPGADTADFWRACATTFRDTPGVVFSLYQEPVRRKGAGWSEWRGAMQPLVSAIRSTGARQVIAAAGFQDSTGFQDFTSANYLQDSNLMYEVHPYFDTASTDDQRTANFGNLAGIFPILAGAWGMPFGKPLPACTAIPADTGRATEMLFQTVAYFDARAISWSAADFAPGSLIRAGADYSPTSLDTSWTCDAASNAGTGIGQFILLWLTGDPGGFGSLQASQIASAAAGFPGPVAPGEIVTVFGQGIGPAQTVAASYDASGRLPTGLAEVQISFDGVPAPLFAADAFQVNVQVPWEVAGHTSTVVQLVYRGVPSNKVELPVVDTVPGIFPMLGTTQAAVINQDGTVNDAAFAAPRGTVVSFFSTGLGQSSPAVATGTAAPGSGGMANPITFRMASTPVEVLYAGPAPGLVGVTQINARIPASLPITGPADRVSVTVAAGESESRQGLTFWVK